MSVLLSNIGRRKVRTSDDWVRLVDYLASISGGAVNVTATGATTPISLAARAARELYFEDFGAVGNGSTDDTSAINACLAAALSAGVWAKGTTGKTYKTTTSITLSNGAKVDLNGATLKPTSSGEIKGFTVAQTGVGSSTTLASSAAAGDRTISVTSASAFAVGRYVLFSWTNGATSNAHYHVSKITSVSGTTIGIAPVAPVAINSGWTHTLSVFTGTNVKIKGDIDGSAAGSWRTITGITKANPAVVTYTGTALTNGTQLFIDGVVGMTEINRGVVTVANATATTFECSGLNSSGYSTYTSGGAVKPLCYGLYLLNAVEERIDVEVSNFDSGSGVLVGYSYGGVHSVKLNNCGNQQEHSYEAFASTDIFGEVHDMTPAAAGPIIDKCSYMNIRYSGVSSIGASAFVAGRTSGGRGFQANGALHGTFWLGPISDAPFVGLAASSGTSYCSFYGGTIIASGKATGGATTNGVGIWLSNNYNTYNKFFGFDVLASDDNDIEIYATDTGNQFFGCRYDASKVSNAGYAEFFDNIVAADKASASTCEIGQATSEYVTVTGTTGITSFGAAPAGVRRTVRFSGALTITHNATSLILPYGASITTSANDTGRFISLGSGNWLCQSFTSQATRGVQLLWSKTSADFNSTADQALTKNGAFSAFIISSIRVVNPSTSLTTAAGGIYNGASKGGAALVAAGQTYTNANASGAGQECTLGTPGLGRRTDSALYLSLTTGQGSAATADLYVFGTPLS